MNWDQVEGKWKQYKVKVKENWGKLTDDGSGCHQWKAATTRREDPGALRHS